MGLGSLKGPWGPKGPFKNSCNVVIFFSFHFFPFFFFYFSFSLFLFLGPLQAPWAPYRLSGPPTGSPGPPVSSVGPLAGLPGPSTLCRVCRLDLGPAPPYKSPPYETPPYESPPL